MSTSINKKVEIYQKSINYNSLSATYKFLQTYMNQLQKKFSDTLTEQFVTQKVLNGYLDYTYFYFSNDFLKQKKLKLGVIYNHHENRFELWLMGTIKQSQKHYWNQLKNTTWNNENTMPQWYVISVELIATPDFEDVNQITDLIIEKVPLTYSQLEKDL